MPWRRIEVDKIFQPDEQGISRWVNRSELEHTKLSLSNNGNGRHGVFFGDDRYVWEKYPEYGKIQRIRTIGKNVNPQGSRSIRKDIRDFYKGKPCVICGCTSSTFIDHKNYKYDDPRVLDTKTQSFSDFQSLCTHCNLQKPQIAKSEERYGATNIPHLTPFNTDFTGDSMENEFWYDPVEFCKKIKQKF